MEEEFKFNIEVNDEEAELISKYRKGSRAIWWGIEDFESSAQAQEDDGQMIYDREQFDYALYEMINNHDSEFGITWVEVRYYLDEYCKL